MTLPLLTHTVELASLTDRLRLWYITDTHLGSRATDEAALQRTVQAIQDDPAALWIAGGDKGEYINISDKRFDPGDCAPWVQVADLGNLAKCQSDRFLELTRPIWSRCLLSIDGNHEEQIYRRYHHDIGAVTAAEMGVPHCRDGAWLRLNFVWPQLRRQTHTYNVVAHHGWGGGRQASSMMGILQEALAVFGADLVLLGHTHRRMRCAALCYAATRTDVLTRKRVSLFGGSFLDGSGYGIRRGYRPAEIGAVCVELTPWTWDIEVRL